MMDSIEEVITVRVTPRSRRPRVEEQEDGLLRVWVSEPPEKGKANEAVRRALAEYFDVRKSGVDLVSGFASREKTFRVRFE